MARELAITLYLFVIRILFNIFKLFPQKKKTVFVASFGVNVLYTLKELEKQSDEKVVILKTSSCKMTFKGAPNRKQLHFKPVTPINWGKSIYHLATSSTIFVDNYYGFLAVTDFRPNTKCIQLWHAAGAIKQFGLKDLSIENRPAKAYKRFKMVYQRFDYVIVGSENMADIFREGFGISKKQILRTGIPRTDFFFDSLAKEEVGETLRLQFPMIKEKKVILYAPTYRDNEMNVSELKMDIDKMYKALKDDYVLFLRLHPAVSVTIDNHYPDFVFNVSTNYNINHLLVITDILISDYSSIPFEFAILNKPMIFFAYDIDEYAETRGFWDNYDKLVPGPIVENTNDLITILKTNDFDMKKINDFSNEWNQYSDGKSSENLIKSIYTNFEEERIVEHN
ncbi:CDP-glycerol glycerophosphotransferase (TagB/SpsB family) [Virgibacillus halotolerans]|uniref:CDP-glycerol glycerophosphotransferase family protein n=1 Tax=Virgibacillus halotolerans TaxID=1071053 RepID=UPI0019602CFB|nr:CDP-glycerol glycerophosphotransferase family protein [Virgibacillus halotolerans]MBM7600170.1 CDP-glycerol glycerophosphotransferase (TagB/SpsB family) [Virgibacillus halotolerans]